jgi:hypothetical protein
MNLQTAKQITDKIWDIYDRNGNQFLDKEEIRRFFIDISHTTHDDILTRNFD